jgi:hypothetical protein
MLKDLPPGFADRVAMTVYFIGRRALAHSAAAKRIP